MLALLAALERGLLGGLMAGIAVVTFAQVVSRYVFDHPLQWSEEVGRFLLVWLTFIGAGVLVRFRDGHPAVDTLPEALPALRPLLGTVSQVLVITGCAALAWGGWRIATLQWAQTSPSLEISMGLVYLCLPVGGLLGLFWGLRRLAGRAGADE